MVLGVQGSVGSTRPGWVLKAPGGVGSPGQCWVPRAVWRAPGGVGCPGVVLVFPGQCRGPRAVLDSQAVFSGRCGVPRAV